MPSAAHSLDQFVRFMVLRFAPAFVGIALLILFGAAKDLPAADRWEGAIKAFEAKDIENPPQSGSVLFIGSSSIRMWDLAKSFPGLATINRGFGGSYLRDSTHYADRIAIPYQPRAIILYAGDNDIASGITADELLIDFKAFEATIRKVLPETSIIYLSIKPSVKRWDQYPEQQKANKLIADYAKSGQRLRFVDVGTPLLGEDGKPRADLLLKDGLHLNEAGYAIWNKVLDAELKSLLAAPIKQAA
ncbi:MAG: SGNH/GDSL hydrolase family protein [Candidatus Hydrogenedentes bacterium]|nr:SGNH/GDSL hydrolase family protein [Candidatus Hydrogenedentota bacterium]